MLHPKTSLPIFLGVLFGILPVVSGAAPATTAADSASAGFVLTSPDARLAARFPDQYVLNSYGCTGGNQSPPLRWSGAPPGTRSFVLTLFDRDTHSNPSGWWHWVIYDLPASIKELLPGAGALQSDLLPAHARQGRTDLGTDAYHGPCPAMGDAPHRYVFTLYALDVDGLDVPADPSGAMVVSTLHEHLLGQAEFIVHHAR